MELDDRSKEDLQCQKAKTELENRISQYMSEYELPLEPTIYDYLILSLTSKDMVATFNWDPLLLQAYSRAMNYTNNLPQMVFLHGNVAVGYCEEDNIAGNAGRLCRCGKPFKPTKLLFPVKNKNYTSNIAISKFWSCLENALEIAYMITIFGYSAPKSDKAAIDMLKKAWGKVEDRNLEEIELIDLRPEDEVVDSWNEFIHTHHYSYHTSFFDTTLGRCPRRSCEATFDRLMMNKWLKGNNGFKEGMSFSDIDRLTCDLIIDEDKKRGTKKLLENPYN